MTSRLVQHRYLSTYCLHELHSSCRLTCKHCEAPCICDCHRDASMALVTVDLPDME